MTKQYNKLVRDNIPEIITRAGHACTISRLNDDSEYFAALDEKLKEEVGEYLVSHNPNELADILEVVYAIAKHRHAMGEDNINELRYNKFEYRGAFGKRVFLISVNEEEDEKGE